MWYNISAKPLHYSMKTQVVSAKSLGWNEATNLGEKSGSKCKVRLTTIAMSREWSTGDNIWWYQEAATEGVL